MSLPFIPIVNDKFGRRWSIFGGSLIMVIGALIQGFSQHGELHNVPSLHTSTALDFTAGWSDETLVEKACMMYTDRMIP